MDHNILADSADTDMDLIHIRPKDNLVDSVVDSLVDNLVDSLMVDCLVGLDDSLQYNNISSVSAHEYTYI